MPTTQVVGPEPGTIAMIVDIQLERLMDRVSERGIALEITPTARAQIAREGYDPVYGARPLKRLIERAIENPLAKRMLAGEIGAGDGVTVDYSTGGEFVFDRSGEVERPQPTL